MTTEMNQLANILKEAKEKWQGSVKLSDKARQYIGDRIEVFVAMPTGPDTYDVAPVEVSMMSEVPEYGWDDDEMLGGEVVLILTSDNIQQCTMVNGQLEAKE